jgi:hypothetical protein
MSKVQELDDSIRKVSSNVQRNIDERDPLNASQFSFDAHCSTALQCMRLTDHLTLITAPVA